MAVDMFLKIEGIKGESRDSQYSGTIDVESFSWGASNSGSASVGGGSGAGKADIQDFHFVTRTNVATMPLLTNLVSGKHITEAYLYVRKAGEKAATYLEWKLEEVMVSSYQIAGSGGEDVTLDQFSLNFAKVTGSYREQRADGSLNSPTTFTFDLVANR
jgi:type VI secretion system secreted protein Hcp